MNLEEWLLRHNIKDMAMKDYNNYIYYYKQEEPEEYSVIFGDKN
ncbi:hypothetical protein ACTFIN_11220 [Clostridium cagae]|nr:MULTISPECIES: hypothetical protein [unclassified Clostridium]